MRLNSVIAMLLLAVSLPMVSQVRPPAAKSESPFVVGAGISYFYTEMFSNHVEGPTVWADWNFIRGPSFVRGFGVEAEARYLDFGQPQGQNLRMVTAGGGPIYTWRHFRNFHPYGKFLVDYGGMAHIKIPSLPSAHPSDKWTTYACGGGVEFRAWHNVWVRADYEYQFWRVKFFNPNSFLTPRGLTVGAAYDFGQMHAH